MQEKNNLQSSEKEDVAGNEKEVTIDFGRMFRAIWHFMWLIVLTAIVFGAAAFGVTKLFIPYQYESEVVVVADNVAAAGATQSAEYAAYKVHAIVMTNDYKLNELAIPLELDESDVRQVSAVISNRQIITITVTHSNSNTAFAIAEQIVATLPEYVDNITAGKQVADVIDTPRKAEYPSSPSAFTNTVLGAIIGFIVCCLIVAIRELFNNDIYQDEYLIETYQVPVLANIPDSADLSLQKHYGYRYRAPKNEKEAK